MMRFGGLAQAMNLIKLISSLSKHHSDPSCPIIHGNGIITRDARGQTDSIVIRALRPWAMSPLLCGLFILNTD